MKLILKFEYLALLTLSLYLFSTMSYSWWWYPLLLLTPDIGLLGYVINSKIGAITYNTLHFLGLGIALYVFGVYAGHSAIALCGVILMGHISVDRFFGYGLKYPDSFKHTHLGKIGTDSV